MNKSEKNFYFRLPCFYHCMVEYDTLFNNVNFLYKNLTLAQTLGKWMYQQ